MRYVEVDGNCLRFIYAHLWSILGQNHFQKEQNIRNNRVTMILKCRLFVIFCTFYINNYEFIFIPPFLNKKKFEIIIETVTITLNLGILSFVNFYSYLVNK